MQSRVTFKVDGMHCAGCVTRLTNSLRKLDGVAVEDVQVGSARLAYSPGVASLDQVQAAIRKAGLIPVSHSSEGSREDAR